MHPPGDPIEMFDEHSFEGYIGVPREWGLDHYPSLEVDDRRSFGYPVAVPRMPNPDHPSVLEPDAQRRFMDELHAMLEADQSGCVCAATGTGKTVVSLHTSGRLGRTTLIVVHLERLQKQWVEEIHDKLGVPMSRIGIVQGTKCQYEGKDFVVAMVQSLNSRRYPDAFYRYFGTVWYDEAHKMGTAAFARSIVMFPACYKSAMSATWDRKDGGHAVFEHHLGPVKVTSTAEALPMDVFVIEYHNPRRVLDYDEMAMAKALAEDPVRNERLARNVFNAWQKGRMLMAVGHLVDHIQLIMRRVIAMGVPEAEVGLFVGQEFVLIPDPARPGKTKKVKQKVSDEELSRIKNEASIIFCTYGMMTEGIDIARLDAGIELTPRATAKQLIGRIRRPRPGKRRPLWVTFVDTGSTRALRYYKARMRDYLSTNVEVVYGNEQSSRGSAGRQEGEVLGRGA